MAKNDRVENDALVEAGLAAMRQCGKPLVRVPSNGRALIYALPTGETVRVRTCNDHVLIVVGDRPTPDAKLNIEGTEWLLVVMPEVERTAGKIIAYLLPTAEVEAEARRTHQEWLSTRPKTNGDNKTWNLWFKGDAPAKANNYAIKWAKYRLDGVIDVPHTPAVKYGFRQGDIKSEVEHARQRIAEVARVPIEAVKIIINFEG